jgi:phospholipid/cholesterol/gamma-HCH transport system ATP-binding protein
MAGLPERRAVQRRMDRVMSMLHTLPGDAQRVIIDSLGSREIAKYRIRRRPPVRPQVTVGAPRPRAPEPQPRPRAPEPPAGDGGGQPPRRGGVRW